MDTDNKDNNINNTDTVYNTAEAADAADTAPAAYTAPAADTEPAAYTADDTAPAADTTPAADTAPAAYTADDTAPAADTASAANVADAESSATAADTNITTDIVNTKEEPPNEEHLNEEPPNEDFIQPKPTASEWIMQHKWIIAVIVIVSILIIAIALFFGYKGYIKYQENQAQKQNKNQNIDLNLCKYGLNSAKTNCKYKQCAPTGQINSIYGSCKELATFCAAGPTYKGVTAKNKKCIMNCNYTGTLYGKYKPVWKPSYPKSITAYQSIWSNTASGNCITTPKCKANGGIPPPGQTKTNAIADCGYKCKQKCVTPLSGHKTTGKCTGNGCPYGMNTPKTQCNKSCPATGSRHSEIISDPINFNVFMHSAGGLCLTNCIVKKGPKFLPGNDKYTCHANCPFPGISITTFTDNSEAIVCKTKCIYGATHSKQKCNDTCDYPHEQNTINGACLATFSNPACNFGYTHQGLNKKPHVWGYLANHAASNHNGNNNNPKMHGCFSSKKKNGSKTLYTTVNATGGKLLAIACLNGVSKTKGNPRAGPNGTESVVYGTKCNAPCPNNMINGVSIGTASKHVQSKTGHPYCIYNPNTCKSNYCHTNCGNRGITVNHKYCNQNCPTKHIAHTLAGTMKKAFNGHNPIQSLNNIACQQQKANGAFVTICANTGSGACVLSSKIKKYGLNGNYTGHNSVGPGYCSTKNAINPNGTEATILGGTTFQAYYNTVKGACVHCTNGVNYKKTNCNRGPMYTNGKKYMCAEYSSKGANCVYQPGADNAGQPFASAGGWISTAHAQAPWGVNTNVIPAKNYHWAWNTAGGTGTCVSVGPGAKSSARNTNNNHVHCVNCNWGGRTRLRSKYDFSGYQRGMSKRICTHGIGCPYHNTRTIKSCCTKFPSIC